MKAKKFFCLGKEKKKTPKLEERIKPEEGKQPRRSHGYLTILIHGLVADGDVVRSKTSGLAGITAWTSLPLSLACLSPGI